MSADPQLSQKHECCKVQSSHLDFTNNMTALTPVSVFLYHPCTINPEVAFFGAQNQKIRPESGFPAQGELMKRTSLNKITISEIPWRNPTSHPLFVPSI